MKRYLSFDGAAIAYQQWGTPDDTPPVLLQHGFVVDATTNWVAPGVVAALQAAGRWVVAPDARGHGASDKPEEPSRYGEEAMARDVSVLIDKLGVAQVDLVGYSMGGVVAAIAATREPRIRRLIISGVGASIVELGGLDTRVMPSADVLAALLADEADPSLPGAPFRQLADAIGADRHALARQAGAAHATPVDLASIKLPTLVLCGADDPLAVRPAVLAGAIVGARWRVLPGDHLGVVGHPDFAPAIVGFLGGP